MTNATETAPRFDVGRVVMTPGAEHAMREGRASLMNCLRRHTAGDWGDMDAEDIETNNTALVEGTRLMSSYNDGGLRSERYIAIEAALGKTIAAFSANPGLIPSAALDEVIRAAEMVEPNVEKVWVITEWDRSVTTVLLPSEY